VGRYLDLARQARSCDKSDQSDKSPSNGCVVQNQRSLVNTFGRLNRFYRIVAALESRCPALVPGGRWQLAVDDGRRLLALWGDQAEALGWTARDLFGLPKPPTQPHPSYSRLSRYDETGLIWLLRGRQVVALTEAAAVIQSATGAITIYRRHNKPALGPVGAAFTTSSRRSAGMPHDHR
jgi:hypothetical protein